MQSFALPGVFSGIIGFVPVAFHLAQSPHHPFTGQHLASHKHPSSFHWTAEKVHKTMT